MAELEAVLTANIKELERKLDKAEKQATSYGKRIETVNKGVDTSFRRTGANLNKENQKLNRSFKGTSAGAVEFGRLIGDLPFGIQGVANNVQQLAFVMGGGAALQIGIAGVTALMLVLEKRGISLNAIFNDLSETTKKYATATKEIVAPVRAEVAELNALVKIANDTTIATNARQRAVDRLNKEYGKYLGNLDLESVKTKDVRDQINRLTDSLLKNAQARASQDLIQSIFNERQEKLVKLTQRQRNAANSVAAEVKRLTENTAAFASVDTSKPLTEQIKQIEGIVNAYGGQGSSLVRLLDNNVKEYNRAVADTRNYSNETKKALEPVLNLFEQLTVKDLLSELDEVQKEVVVTANKIANGIFESDGIPVGAFKLDKSKLTGIFVDPVSQELKNLGILLNRDGPILIEPGLTNIEQKFANFKERIKGITVDIGGAISSGFASIGQSIAQGGNLLSAVGDAILQTLGSIITQLGQASIAAGVAAISLKNLFSNPAAAIAAGAALVTIGSALSAARGSVGSIGTSNVGGQGSRGFSGSNFQSFSSSGFGGGRVVFEISGRKLIGVLNNNLSANERLGGNISIG